MDTPGHPHRGPTTTPHLEALYAGTPPWDIGRPQPAFRELAAAGAIGGRVLDAGCGTGEHTLMAAALGLEATGIDLAATALAEAERKARQRGLPARFLRQDALRLDTWGESFDTVLDCALFHAFTDADRATYVAGLRAVLPPGGRCFVLAYSDRHPDRRVPHRLTQEQVTAAFTDGWRVEDLQESSVEVAIDPGRITAWLLTVTRI